MHAVLLGVGQDLQKFQLAQPFNFVYPPNHLNFWRPPKISKNVYRKIAFFAAQKSRGNSGVSHLFFLSLQKKSLRDLFPYWRPTEFFEPSHLILQAFKKTENLAAPKTEN